ncbi:MAG TPA: efflux RND transporter periplasmic adaptor subunit [Thiobacillaceae bacterium]|nr:efflux RND transporter periplasmic adaptor subunit [Thiobacillaceae bacterium]HNU64946.1 efflux RND transporter periplasmic adaptor subunit [Thiobacillaceae bacterium]
MNAMRMRRTVFLLLAGTVTASAAEYPGTLDWASRVDVAMPVPGVVESVAVVPGQRVTKGELLATLNPTLFRTNVSEARADVERATQELVDAGKDLERVKELYARTVSATSELDAAQLRHDRARAELSAAQARLERSRRRLEESELRAPFDAVILTRMAQPGLAVATSCQPTPLFTLAMADRFMAHITLSADQAAPLHVGQKAEIVIGARTIAAEIWGISASTHAQYHIEVPVPRMPGLLPGQGVTLRMP